MGRPFFSPLRAQAREGLQPQAGREGRGDSLLSSSPAFVILTIAAATTINFAGPDLWRHLLVGRIVLQTSHLPLRDSFSYTAFGHPWLQHEWLAQTIMALLYQALGASGLKLLKLCCAAATISLLAAAMGQTGAPARVQRPVLLFVALALAPWMQFRPQLFTYLLLTWVLLLLAADAYRGSAPLWLAVPAFALWSNLHGGFVVGLGAIGIYGAVVGASDLWAHRGLSRCRRLAAITAACAAATLVNPLGIGVWFTVMHSLTDSFVKGSMADWQPLLSALGPQLRAWNPAVVIYLIPIGLFAALAISVVMAPETDDAALVIVAAAFVFGAFDALRNMALAVIAAAIPLTHHAGLVSRRSDERREADLNRADSARGFSPALAGALAILLAWYGGLFSPRLRLGFDYPVGAVAFLKEHDLHGNILCFCRWGDYVIWHLGPRSKVFIDPRWELVYPHEVMEEFIKFNRGGAGATEALDQYPNDFVLVPPTSPSFQVVAHDENWKVIYSDPGAVLFARASSPLALNAVHRPAGSPGDEYFP